MKAVAIVGPTASGKTALSLSLASAIGGEILCCDSMQVYRGMDIGTAKPTQVEQTICPHHLLDIASPSTPFSAAAYADAAMEVLKQVSSRGAVPIFCGGTGLYLDAVRTLRHGGETPPSDPALRARLTEEAKDAAGREALYERLAEIDPAAASATHPNNVRRVVRALELYELTGHTKTELDAKAAVKNPELELLILGLRYESRELLRARIDARVDRMLKDGLVEETERLSDAGLFEANTTAAQAIGYKELLAYLEGNVTLAEATAHVKAATRRYAKRQMTYFRAMPGVLWLTADRDGQVRPTEELTQEALLAVRPFLSSDGQAT
jgi:tRNA dimethylallyltransferase